MHARRFRRTRRNAIRIIILDVHHRRPTSYIMPGNVSTKLINFFRVENINKRTGKIFDDLRAIDGVGGGGKYGLF